MADWPATLPPFLLDGYQRGGGEDGVIRTELGAGTKVRPRFTTPPPEPVMASVMCTLAQLDTLLTFYETTLKRTLPFNRKDDTKAGLPIVEYRFTGRPSYEPVGYGQLYRVTLPLEILN